MKTARHRLPLLLILLASLTAALSQCTCGANDESARAYRLTSRSQLIGGPRAMGEVGDFMLENDKIRVIVQDDGFSRGFGVFGGNIIDADLVRPGTGVGNSAGGVGQDNFGEMFPAFFLEALAPSVVVNPETPTDPSNKLAAIEVTSDGADGVAEITVRGYGGDFIALTQSLNEVLLGDSRDDPVLLFETKYRLEPGKRYVEIVTKVQNVAVPERRLELPNEFGGVDVPTPFGDVLLFGAGNSVFLPHDAGFDMRFRLQDVFDRANIQLPALPGLVADFIASSGKHVSYGLLGAAPENAEQNFAYRNRDQFPNAKPYSVHVPFIASAFTGVFTAFPPEGGFEANDRAPGGDDEYSYTRYFIIGSGDVASVSDVAFDLAGDATGALQGRVTEDISGTPAAGANVLILTADGSQKVTHARTDADGRFRARLRGGDYQALVVQHGHEIPLPTPFSIIARREKFVNLTSSAPARVTVTVVEPGVGRVPAKVTLVGTTPPAFAGRDTREWLFDLSLGQSFRYTDFEPDTDDPLTRRYIEEADYTHDGVVTLTARPGTYTVVASRGPEYSRVETEVTLVAGAQKAVDLTVERVVDTADYIAADFHLHSGFSLDSSEPLPARIISYAGEGVEYAVATDHNFVVDYQPTIAALGLERFITSAIGLELTTIDRGHFNGFPLRLGDGALQADPDEDGAYANTIAARTFGSFIWSGRPPQEIFDEIRARAPKDPACLAANPGDAASCDDLVDKVIVQINHPRDSILGYFSQYALNQETLEVEGTSGIIAPNLDHHPEFAAENFSFDFDAVEVFNGKRYEYLHNYVVPEGLPVNATFGAPIDQEACCPLVPGEVYRERPSFDCDDAVRDCTFCTDADVQSQLDNDQCDATGILFPGVVEDWMNLLSAGRRLVGTANSDSHSPHKEEPGYPRTYVRVPNDTPRQVTAQDVVRGFLSGDVLMTNGPFVLPHVTSSEGSAGMGETLDAGGGEITVDVTVRHAPWVVPSRAIVYFDGDIVATEALDADDSGVVELSVAFTPGRDGFVIVEVTGDTNLFPSAFPNEIPPIQFTDVIGSVGGAFGFGVSKGLSPELVYQATPYALTNPVWIDQDGDGEVQPSRDIPALARTKAEPAAPMLPGVDVMIEPTTEDTRTAWERWADELPAGKRRWLESRLPKYLWPTRHPADVRRVLVQFMRHAH